MLHRALQLFLRVLLFLVPLTALTVLGFVVVSFVSAQLEDLPAAPHVALLQSSSEQPLDISPETIEQSLVGLYLRTQETSINLPASENAVRRTFTIDPGETALTVATRLEEEGFITDGNLFRLFMRQNGIDQKLAAGDFEISANMTMTEIADRLQRPRYEEIVFTVPEGMRAEEVAELLDVKGVMDGASFLAVVQGGSASAGAIGEYDWLPAGLTTLEGYLFPDTYRLPIPAQPSDLIGRMLDNFESKVTEDILAPARQAGRSLEQTVIMASIVEREAPRADERPLVASVYWNRASGACSTETGGAYLQADPTVQYAAGRAGEWWWKPPNVESYATVQSPYNTYLRPGLPPAAIASPGLSAIEGAAKPAETRYCFFVATGDDGGHVFATTLAEHQQNIGQFQK